MRDAAAKSTFWSVVELLGGQGVGFLVFLVLARLLTPEDYGLMTLAYVVVNVPAVILVQGFPDALVQRPVIEDVHVSTALWCNLGFAAVLLALTQALAGAAAALGHPALAPVLRWLSLHFVFMAAVSIPSAMYRRRLSFRTFALRTVAAGTLGGAVGIAMAATGWGVWALVGNQLSQDAVSVLVIWGGFGWIGLEFSGAAFKELWPFSAQVMLANLVGYGASQMDRLAVGVFLGERALGYYYLAMRLISLIGELTHNRIQEVSLPVLSPMRDEPQRLERTYVWLVWASAAAWVPLIAGLGLMAPLLVPLVVGPHWAEAAPLLRVMTLCAVTCPIVYHTSRPLLAVGRAEAWRDLSVLQLAVAAAFYGAAAQFGLLAVGAAFAASFLAAAPFHFRALRREAGIAAKDVLGAVLTVYAAGTIMCLVVAGILGAAPVFGRLVIPAGVFIGGSTYILALWAIAPGRTAEAAKTAARLLPAFTVGRLRDAGTESAE